MSFFVLFKGDMTTSGSDNWKVITNFLLKAVRQDLLFPGVTAFNYLSADFESMLMPRSSLKLSILVKIQGLAVKKASYILS